MSATSSDLEECDSTSLPGSGDSASHCSLDEPSAALCSSAPLRARIGEALHHSFGEALPTEVEAFLLSRGARVRSSELLKISFNATFLVFLDPPLQQPMLANEVVVQIHGAEVGDKAAFFGRPSSARAMELAREAGVRVPTVLGQGHCSSAVGPLDFVVQERIVTQTVENEVRAPDLEWECLVTQVNAKLCARSLTGADVGSLPHFRSLSSHLQWLQVLVPLWDDALRDALSTFATEVALVAPEDVGTVLVHQDLNDGNVLCSELPSGTDPPWVHFNGIWNVLHWDLDAVIDWESAAVVDARFLSADEPWATARAFAHVVKGSRLAEQLRRGALPRCELLQLVEAYSEALSVLSEVGRLPMESWAARAQRARAALFSPEFDLPR